MGIAGFAHSSEEFFEVRFCCAGEAEVGDSRGGDGCFFAVFLDLFAAHGYVGFHAQFFELGVEFKGSSVGDAKSVPMFGLLHKY